MTEAAVDLEAAGVKPWGYGSAGGHAKMKRSGRETMLLIAGVLLGAAPFAFGLLRAATTGTDWRYLWAALAAIWGSGMVIGIGKSRSPGSVITVAVAALALVAGTLFALVEASFLAHVHGAAPWIVSFAFSFCVTVGVVLYYMSQPRNN